MDGLLVDDTLVLVTTCVSPLPADQNARLARGPWKDLGISPDTHSPSSECIQGLTGILALSAQWIDCESGHVIRTLLRAVVDLLHLDFAYARVVNGNAHGAEEIVQLGKMREPYASPQDLAAVARSWLDTGECDLSGRLSIARLALGPAARNTQIALGSCRIDFPNNTEKLLLDAAAIQATHGLHTACHREALRADLTERERQLRYSEKNYRELVHLARMSSLGALTASIAHEVNQPLAGIMTNASTGLRMLSADPPNVSGALETVRRTIRDAHRASDVIARLRSMVSRKDTVREQVDLNEIAQEIIGLASSELKSNRLTLQTRFSSDLPVVYGDRVQLQQVILNLLLNASDATKDITGRAREILLKTELQDDGEVRLTVVDSGIGIDPGRTDELFEPFYTTKDAGMGIGLSISRSIIERHGGRLWAEPNDPHGASFSFSVPPISRT